MARCHALPTVLVKQPQLSQPFTHRATHAGSDRLPGHIQRHLDGQVAAQPGESRQLANVRQGADAQGIEIDLECIDVAIQAQRPEQARMQRTDGAERVAAAADPRTATGVQPVRQALGIEPVLCRAAPQSQQRFEIALEVMEIPRPRGHAPLLGIGGAHGDRCQTFRLDRRVGAGMETAPHLEQAHPGQLMVAVGDQRLRQPGKQRGAHHRQIGRQRVAERQGALAHPPRFELSRRHEGEADRLVIAARRQLFAQGIDRQSFLAVRHQRQFACRTQRGNAVVAMHACDFLDQVLLALDVEAA